MFRRSPTSLATRRRLSRRAGSLLRGVPNQGRGHSRRVGPGTLRPRGRRRAGGVSAPFRQLPLRPSFAGAHGGDPKLGRDCIAARRTALTNVFTGRTRRAALQPAGRFHPPAEIRQGGARRSRRVSTPFSVPKAPWEQRWRTSSCPAGDGSGSAGSAGSTAPTSPGRRRCSPSTNGPTGSIRPRSPVLSASTRRRPSSRTPDLWVPAGFPSDQPVLYDLARAHDHAEPRTVGRQQRDV